MDKQRSPEWFAARAGRITASQAGALLGLSPNQSEDDAFRALVRSINGMDAEFQGNVATEYGSFHEAGALAEYKMETGNHVHEVGFVPCMDWLGASPDSLLDHDGLLEIKCPFGQRDKNPPQFKNLADQPHCYAQIQIQLFCTGRAWAHFFQWSPHGTQLEAVKKDATWLDKHIPNLAAIHSKAKTADPAEYEGPKSPVFDTPEAAKLVAEYDELSEAIDNAQDRKKDIIARMAQMAGEKDAKMAGRNLTLVKKSGSVSYAKAIKKYAPDADLEPFRGNPSESWQLK